MAYLERLSTPLHSPRGSLQSVSRTLALNHCGRFLAGLEIYRFLVRFADFAVLASSRLTTSTVFTTESVSKTNRPPIFLKSARLSLLLLKRTTNLSDFNARAISEAVPAPPPRKQR
jgi:hypothetical protein